MEWRGLLAQVDLHWGGLFTSYTTAEGKQMRTYSETRTIAQCILTTKETYWNLAGIENQTAKGPVLELPTAWRESILSL